MEGPTSLPEALNKCASFLSEDRENFKAESDGAVFTVLTLHCVFLMLLPGGLLFGFLVAVKRISTENNGGAVCCKPLEF